MQASPPHTFARDLLQTVKHSPIETNNAANRSNENNAPVIPQTFTSYHSIIGQSGSELTPKAFLLEEIKEKPDYYSSAPDENIENLLLTVDIIKTPANSFGFDSTPTESEDETTILPAKEEEEEQRGLDEALLLTNNNTHHYQFHYPQPGTVTQGFPESMTQFEAKTKADAIAATNALEQGMKRRREEEPIALAPMQEKAVFPFNPRSPPAPIAAAAAFATLAAAPETKQQSSPLYGFAPQLLSNVSGSSSQWGALPAATAYEAASKNTFTYPTMKTVKAKTEGCRCQQSKCLKLYCACFRDGKVCVSSCKCVSCENTENNGKVTVARQEVLSKKPNAFSLKTCKCAKSRCLKMYCACYSAGQACGDHCKCGDCSNPRGVRASRYFIEEKVEAKENVHPTM